MFIQTEETPNPETLKFLPGRVILSFGTAEFKAPSETEKSPLAQRLFDIQGITGVFLGSDFVSVTKAGNTDWPMLKPLILAALMEHLSMDQPVIDTDFFETPGSGEGDDDEITGQIKILLEERVRPMVAMDGGDIVFGKFEDGIVYLHMRGACAGCPSATATLKMGIENMLRHYIPEVREVRPLEAF